MIVMTKKRQGVDIKKVWLADEMLKDGDIVRYYDAFIPFGKIVRKGKTIVNNLEDDEEQLFSHFSKSCKYKINRAPREGVTCTIIESKDITDKQIEEFVDYFIAFHESKGLPNEDRQQSIEDMITLRNQNNIVLAYAEVNQKIIVYHTHLIDANRAFLRESASLFRVEEDISHNVVGMANRYLHYEEMKYFKSIGKSVYDWGGAGEGEAVKSITEFKETFGGEKIPVYDCVKVRTVKGFVANAAFAIIMLLRK